MIKTVILTEWIKNRHTFTPWFLAIGSLLVPFVSFMIYANRWSFFQPEAGSTGWTTFLQMNLSFLSSLLMPVWLILLVALNIHPEQKSNAWKRLFVTPVGKGTLFVGKLLYLCLQVTVTVAGFTVAICVAGVLLQALHPSLCLPLSAMPLSSLLATMAGLIVCSLPILAIQYVFSLLTNNVLVPAAMGILAVMVSMVVAQGWSYAVYDPYVFPMLYSWNSSGKTLLSHWLGLPSIIWLSLAIGVTVAYLGGWRFKQRPVR